MADPIVLPGQNPQIAVQPGQKITGIATGGQHVTGGTSRTKATATITSTGTYVPPVVPVPPDPVPVPPPVSGVPLTFIPVPNTPAPSLGQSFVDQFGNTVTCVSTVTRQVYPLTEPWNIGTGAESRIMLNFASGSTQILLGVAPYTLLRTIQVPPYAFWSTIEAHTIYGAQGNALVKIPDTGGPFQTVHDFGAAVSIGNYEGGVSSDGCVALTAGGVLYLWDVVNNQEVSHAPMPAGMDGFQISRSGKYMVVRGGNTRVYDADNLVNPRVLDPKANHGACCLIDGVDYYVGNNATKTVNGSIVATGVTAYRLSDGAATVLVAPSNAFANGHVGSYGPNPSLSGYDPIGMAGLPGCDQVVTANMNGTVNLFGFSHRQLTKAYSAMTSTEKAAAYRGEPQAVADQSGKRVIFMGWETCCCISERP